MEESIGKHKVAKQRRYALEHWEHYEARSVFVVWIENHLRLRAAPVVPGEMVHGGKLWSLLKLLSLNVKACSHMGNPRCYFLCQLDFMPAGCTHRAPQNGSRVFVGTAWCDECAVCMRCHGWAGSSSCVLFWGTPSSKLSKVSFSLACSSTYMSEWWCHSAKQARCMVIDVHLLVASKLPSWLGNLRYCKRSLHQPLDAAMCTCTPALLHRPLNFQH